MTDQELCSNFRDLIQNEEEEYFLTAREMSTKNNISDQNEVKIRHFIDDYLIKKGISPNKVTIAKTGDSTYEINHTTVKIVFEKGSYYGIHRFM